MTVINLQGRSQAVLITDIAGSIGHYLGCFLRAQGYIVVGHVEPSPECCDDFYQVDILELPERFPFQLNHRWDAMVHLAAIRAPREVPEQQIFEVNVIGTYKVLHLAVHH